MCVQCVRVLVVMSRSVCVSMPSEGPQEMFPPHADLSIVSSLIFSFCAVVLRWSRSFKVRRGHICTEAQEIFFCDLFSKFGVFVCLVFSPSVKIVKLSFFQDTFFFVTIYVTVLTAQAF